MVWLHSTLYDLTQPRQACRVIRLKTQRSDDSLYLQSIFSNIHGPWGWVGRVVSLVLCGTWCGVTYCSWMACLLFHWQRGMAHLLSGSWLCGGVEDCIPHQYQNLQMRPGCLMLDSGMEDWDPLILQTPCNHLRNVIFIYFIYFFFFTSVWYSLYYHFWFAWFVGASWV